MIDLVLPVRGRKGLRTACGAPEPVDRRRRQRPRQPRAPARRAAAAAAVAAPAPRPSPRRPPPCDPPARRPGRQPHAACAPAPRPMRCWPLAGPECVVGNYFGCRNYMSSLSGHTVSELKQVSCGRSRCRGHVVLCVGLREFSVVQRLKHQQAGSGDSSSEHDDTARAQGIALRATLIAAVVSAASCDCSAACRGPPRRRPTPAQPTDFLSTARRRVP